MNNRYKSFLRLTDSRISFACLLLAVSLVHFVSNASAQQTFTQALQVFGLGRINKVAYFPDGTRVAVAADSSVNIYNASTGARVGFITGHTSRITAVAVSNDNSRILTGSIDKTARIWNAQTGALIRNLPHSLEVYAVAISADGTRILTGTVDRSSDANSTAQLWNATTGALIDSEILHSYGITSIAFSPDGTQFVSNGGAKDSTLTLWDVATFSPITIFSNDRTTGHLATVNSVAFSPDGNSLLSGSSDRTAKLWGIVLGGPPRTFSGHTNTITSVAFSKDGTRIVTGSYDNTAKIWDVATGAIQSTLATHTLEIASVDFSADSTRVVTGSADQTARVWNAATGALVRVLKESTGPMNAVALSPDGTRLLTGSGAPETLVNGFGREPRIWNTATGALVRSLTGHTGDVAAAVYSPDGTKIMTGSWDGTARLWNAANGSTIHNIDVHEDAVLAVAIAPNGARLLTGSADHTAGVWDAATGALIRPLFGHTEAIQTVAFSPDGEQIMTGGNDKTIRFWRVSTGALLNTLTFPGLVAAAAYSPNSRKILAIDNEAYQFSNHFPFFTNRYTAQVIELSTGARSVLSNGLVDYANGAAFSPNGDLALVGIGSTAHVFDVITSGPISTYIGHTGDVEAVAFNSDQTRIVTGSVDATARIWETNLTPLPTPTPDADQLAAIRRYLLGVTSIATGLDQNGDGTVDIADLLQAIP